MVNTTNYFIEKNGTKLYGTCATFTCGSFWVLTLEAQLLS